MRRKEKSGLSYRTNECIMPKNKIAGGQSQTVEKIQNPSPSADISGLRAGPSGPVGLRNAPAGAVRRRRRHRQGNFAANCVRGAIATSARFAVKFCRRAAEPSAACGGCSEAEQGQRSQNASAVQGAPHDAGTATRTYTRGNRRVRQLPCAAVASCGACRVSRHAQSAGAASFCHSHSPSSRAALSHMSRGPSGASSATPSSSPRQNSPVTAR